MLETFMRRPGAVLSRLDLLEHAWDYAYENRSNVVDVYVRYLREKIDRPFGLRSIETVRGAGYRLRADGGAPVDEPAADPRPPHARVRARDGGRAGRDRRVPLPAARVVARRDGRRGVGVPTGRRLVGGRGRRLASSEEGAPRRSGRESRAGARSPAACRREPRRRRRTDLTRPSSPGSGPSDSEIARRDVGGIDGPARLLATSVETPRDTVRRRRSVARGARRGARATCSGSC